MAKINVLSREVAVLSVQEEGYICLTDIARSKNEAATDDLIRNWLRNRNTLEFLGIWEHLYNPGFNPVEFDGIKSQRLLWKQSGSPVSGRFCLSCGRRAIQWSRRIRGSCSREDSIRRGNRL